ncbi:MAG: SDR family oxidoreductase [Betaproteobacteria bacterium]|nr:SDR family oxidoreductase [Betaproteobacteria bacterium]
MKILICGAQGFIGAAIAERLTTAGHDVLRGVRHPQSAQDVAIDYSRDVSEDYWLPRLQGIDVVINAVGIIVERPGVTFEAIHHKAPQALFAACQKMGVKRVVQISALGADQGTTPYFVSKRAADDGLMRLPIAWQILRPGLVYGANGASAQFFRQLASLPVISLPAGGRQKLQPIHIDDLTKAVCLLIKAETPPHQCLELVGSEVVEYREMLRLYRAAMDFPKAVEIPIPAAIISITAAVVGKIPGAILTPDTWAMLQAGNTGDVAVTIKLLGREPRAARTFITSGDSERLREQALSAWRVPLMRATLALIWLATSFITAFIFPRENSLEMLAKAGLTGLAGQWALFAGIVLDAVMGVITLLRPSRGLWWLQGAVIVFFSTVIAFALPEYLWHPFGPILKNVPILAMLFLLLAEERR